MAEAKNDIGATNVTATDHFIIRKYAGVQSREDMARINAVTEEFIAEFVAQHKPIRILLDLHGEFTVTPKIYEEAISILQQYDIDRVAVRWPRDKGLQALTQNVQETFGRVTQYEIFADRSLAEQWLNEP